MGVVVVLTEVHDLDLKRRRDEILQSMAAREAPRVLYLIVVIIVFFDLAYLLVGIEFGGSYLLSDALQSAYMLATAVLIQRGVIRAKWAPAAFCAAVVVNNMAVSYQYTLVGISAVGVIYLFMASYGAIALLWRPFLISAAIMWAVTAFALLTNEPVNGPGWLITASTALAVSAVILYGRRQGAVLLAEANRTIEALATRDALTGLLNRRGLEESLPLLVGQAQRQALPVFAVFVDIAGLKRANDTHGHHIGDLVISRTAEALQRQSRQSELVCRWGGDEFVVLGIGDEPGADEFADRIVQSIEVDGLQGLWEPKLSVGASSAPSHNLDIEMLIVASDGKMYARRRGD